MASLADIRAKLAASSQSSSNGTGETGPTFPHWNMQENGESTIRFLPDGDNSNTFFWVEKQMIKLPFAGIKGEADMRPTIVQVPCIEMYDAKTYCPVLTEVRSWFKDKTLEEIGRKYWKKRSYLFQGLVVKDGLNEETPPENPIRRFTLSPQIFQLVKAALLDEELDELPTDYLRGIDFKIIKTSKGGFADYSTSKWSRNERALSDVEHAAISQYGLLNLSDLLPKRPDAVELEVIKSMFEASVDGEAYDPARWGTFYRPSGYTAPAETNATAVYSVPATPKAAPVIPKASAPVADSFDENDDVPFDTSPQEASKAQDIMAVIRARQAAAATS